MENPVYRIIWDYYFGMAYAKKSVDLAYTSAYCHKGNIMASPEDNDLLSREIIEYVGISHQYTVSLSFLFFFLFFRMALQRNSTKIQMSPSTRITGMQRYRGQKKALF